MAHRGMSLARFRAETGVARATSTPEDKPDTWAEAVGDVAFLADEKRRHENDAGVAAQTVQELKRDRAEQDRVVQRSARKICKLRKQEEEERRGREKAEDERDTAMSNLARKQGRLDAARREAKARAKDLDALGRKLAATERRLGEAMMEIERLERR